MPKRQYFKPFIMRRNSSEQRKSMRIAVIEGIPATLIANILGGPILTAYLLFLHANSQQVGFVMAIAPLANMVQIAAAFFMQKMENRKLWILVASMIHRGLWTLTGLIPFLVPNDLQITVFIGMYLVSFICASISGVIWSSLISDLVPPQVRGRYFGIRNTIHWAFASITLLIGGQILERATSEQTGFIILFTIAGICTIWNAFELARYPNPPFEKSQAATGAERLLKPLKDRSFMLATVFIAGFILLQNIAVPLFSFVMLDVLEISYTQLTVVTVVQMIVMMISYYYWGTLNSRIPTITLLLWSLPIIALSCVIWIGMEIIPVIVILVLVHILLGVGQGGYNLLAFNFMIGETPKADRPMYIAMFSAFTGLTGFIGPMIGGALYDWSEGGSTWIQSYGISFFTGAAMLIVAVGIGPFVLGRAKSRR